MWRFSFVRVIVIPGIVSQMDSLWILSLLIQEVSFVLTGPAVIAA